MDRKLISCFVSSELRRQAGRLAGWHEDEIHQQRVRSMMCFSITVTVARYLSVYLLITQYTDSTVQSISILEISS